MREPLPGDPGYVDDRDYESGPQTSIHEAIDAAHKPLLTDPNPFGQWLRSQVARRDMVGQLARVATQDPTWPQPKTREECADYFRGMGARTFVMQAVRQAWDDFQNAQRRQRTKGKRKAARAARKKNRRKH